MRNRRRLLSGHDGTREIWPSFTDVMSTLALILFVLVLLAYVRNLLAGKELAALQLRIDASQEQLRSLHGQLDTGRAELEASRARLRDQQAVIAASNRELDTVKARLQSIAVLRVTVLDRLKRALEAALGSGGEGGAELVTIGDNGSIIINESMVFEYGSSAVKPEAKPLIGTLAWAFGNVLADPDVRANIDTILIQGHADERGSAQYNWDLSARRATAVLHALFDANKTLADSYGSYFAASAYSSYRPLDTAKTEDAYQKNRRIEISVIPKDDSIRQVIEDYVKDVGTQTPPQPPSQLPPAGTP